MQPRLLKRMTIATRLLWAFLWKGLQVAWRKKGVYNSYPPRLCAFLHDSTYTFP